MLLLVILVFQFIYFGIFLLYACFMISLNKCGDLIAVRRFCFR